MPPKSIVSNQAWLLPEGIEEILPDDAWRIEQLRRALLDCFRCWGYELVMPPLLEYLEALLTGAGGDLDLQTFKLTDQVSGRTMGIRADMTPQVARMEAHYLKREGAVRLCYFGPVLLARADKPGSSREPLQFGAELYGSNSVEADAEMLSLMVEALKICAIDQAHIDVGHVGVFKGLVKDGDLHADTIHKLFGALQRKSIPDVTQICAQAQVDKKMSEVLIELPSLHGPVSEFDRAKNKLATAGESVTKALHELDQFIRLAARKLKGVPLYFDLSELRGYHYHTGVLFSAFTDGHGQEIARGGRYDDIGDAFGRARPATGFSADMRQILRAIGGTWANRPDCVESILAPNDDDVALDAQVAKLRKQGERIVYQLPDRLENPLGCKRRLVHKNGAWTVVSN